MCPYLHYKERGFSCVAHTARAYRWLSSRLALSINSFTFFSILELSNTKLFQLSKTVTGRYTPVIPARLDRDRGNMRFESCLGYIVNSELPEMHSKTLPANTEG